MHLLFITSNETGAGGILSRDLDLSRLVTLFLCTVFFFLFQSGTGEIIRGTPNIIFAIANVCWLWHF